MTSAINSMDYGPRDLIGFGEDPPSPKWPGNAKIAIQIVLNFEEGSESTPANPEKDTHTVHIASELGPGRSIFPGRDVNQVGFLQCEMYTVLQGCLTRKIHSQGKPIRVRKSRWSMAPAASPKRIRCALHRFCKWASLGNESHPSASFHQ